MFSFIRFTCFFSSRKLLVLRGVKKSMQKNIKKVAKRLVGMKVDCIFAAANERGISLRLVGESSLKCWLDLRLRGLKK